MHFKPDELRGAQQSQNALEDMQQLGNVWIGPDVAIEGKRVVEPGESVRDLKIILSKKNLPPIPIDRRVLGFMQWSVRSFLAQSGIDITFHKSDLTDEMIKAIENGEKVALPIHVFNHGQRAIEIEGNVMRLFWVNDRNRLRGKNLREIIGKDLVIEGQEGKDWFLGDTEWETRDPDKRFPVPEGSEVCVIVPLSKVKLYIPPSPEPLCPKDNKGRLKDILQPIPAGLNLDFQIGETPHIKLSPDITAVIPMGTYMGLDSHHINSPLIDGGTDWPVRTETVGLDFIELFIYKNK